MNLAEHILVDSNGNYHYQGCIAKPFSHHFTRSEWLVIVGGLEDSQHQIWHSINPTIDARMIAMAAIDWFIKLRNPLPVPMNQEVQPEAPNDQPEV